MKEKITGLTKGLWGAPLGVSIAIVRVLLGVVLITGGWKLAFPKDPEGLVASYIDPGFRDTHKTRGTSEF